jgi:GNAT superfamily N-acetyltransferase
MRLDPLAESDLAAATALCERALPLDRIGTVAAEKLFGSNGARTGLALGVWDGDELVGLLATAGRWVKLLAVAPGVRRRGVGSALLEAARARSRKPLRIFDHPGNYLSPGLDVRYAEGRAFLAQRGFQIVAEVENLRAPLDGKNPLVTEARARELAARAASAGYLLRRAEPADRDALLDFVAHQFAAVWANETARALDGPRRAVHLALDPQSGAPIAFAAADGNNQGLGWFGPAGTAPEHRGRGLGEALLIACLNDVRGLPEAGVIAWIGPKAFYERACGAKGDRRFVVYQATEPGA